MASKKSLITVSSTIMVIIVLCSILLPLFLSYKPSKKIEPTDAKKFFSDTVLHKEWGESYNIVNKIPKDEVLTQLTNYNYVYDVKDLKYVGNEVQQNLLNLIKEQIYKSQKYFNESNLFLQVRYQEATPTSLLIDARWTNRNNYLTLYYNKVNLDINI